MTGFVVKREVSEQTVRDLVVNAFDHGIGYWARVKEHSPFEEFPGACYLSDLPLLEGGFVSFEDATGEGFPEEFRILSRTTLGQGLQVMADRYSRHFADMVNMNHDAATADVLIQCAVFGEVIFG